MEKKKGINKKVLLFLFLLISITGLSIISIINAYDGVSYYEIASYEFDNVDNTMSLTTAHPSATASISGWAQTFYNSLNDATLKQVLVEARKVGSPVATLTCYIYSASTQSATAIPNTLLATSTNNYIETQITTSSTLFTRLIYNFSDLALTKETWYVFVVRASAVTTLDGTNYFKFGADASSTAYSGNSASFHDNAWSTVATSDFGFSVRGLADNTGVTPTPTPHPLDYWNGSAWITPTPPPTFETIKFQVQTNGYMNDLSGGTINWNSSNSAFGFTVTHNGVTGNYYSYQVGENFNLTVNAVANGGFVYTGMAWVYTDILSYETSYTHVYDGREEIIIVSFSNNNGSYNPSPTTWQRTYSPSPSPTINAVDYANPVVEFIFGTGGLLGVGFGFVVIAICSIAPMAIPQLRDKWVVFVGMNIGFVINIVMDKFPMWTAIILVILDVLAVLSETGRLNFGGS